MQSTPREQAWHFLHNETPFHLGMLPTEQSHPATRTLAETLQGDTVAGIALLQEVDEDIASAAPAVFESEAYASLQKALRGALLGGRRVCFSGCGATGRLSILLEACWRRCWRIMARRYGADASVCRMWADRVCSIMTGGDYALIRSVENFEDYESFGRRQAEETGLGDGDVLVAISEGGETSSVIGTLEASVRRGAQGFFVFNNPAEVLCRHIERSRRAIENPAVTVLDLTTGPMAVAGSTRMQATSIELLVVGTALDGVLKEALRQALPPAVLATCPAAWWSDQPPLTSLRRLLDDLSAKPARQALGAWVDEEVGCYRAGGRITYFADACLLDIFTDTTERSPTFMLPPFRTSDDTVSPPPWAFVKHPALSTADTWVHVLGRPPRCLDWDQAVYRSLGGPPRVIAQPPRLGSDVLGAFMVGSEDDSSRYERAGSMAIAMLCGQDAVNSGHVGWWSSFRGAADPFDRSAAVVIGSSPPSLSGVAPVWHVNCRPPDSPLGLWWRLAAKLTLNTVSTATMGCMGRLAGNWMIWVHPTNKKLVDRGTRLIAELAGIDYAAACLALHEAIAALQVSTEPGTEVSSPVATAIRNLKCPEKRR